MVFNVRPNGELQRVELPDKSPYGDNRGLNAWKIYAERRKCDKVIRSGGGQCGAYPYHGEHFAEDRQESDSEHSLAAISIINVMSCFWPELFRHGADSSSQCARLSAEEDIAIMCSRIYRILLYHDYGETSQGDFANDGTRKAEQDQLEIKAFLKLAELFVPAARSVVKAIVSDFIMLTAPLSQTHIPEFLPADQRCIQLAHIADRGDVVLLMFVIELRGKKPSLQYKLEHFGSLSEQEWKAIELTQGDKSFAAVLSLHYIRDCHACHGFAEFAQIIQAACIDVRGEFFPWWESACEYYEVENPLKLNQPL